MIGDLSSVSPLTGFLLSFSDSQSDWMQLAMLALAYVLFLGVLVSPAVAAISFIDRKICGDIQMRIGPNRSSPYGVFQGVADLVKLLSKVSVKGLAAMDFVFYLTIALSLGFLVLGLINIPFSSQWLFVSIDLSAPLVLASILVSRLFLFWAAYRTENSWATVSAFGMFSVAACYLAPMVLALLSPALMAGTLDLQEIAKAQGGLPWQWMAFNGPGNCFSFLVFAGSFFLWRGRLPGEQSFEAEFEGRRLFLLRHAENLSVFLMCAVLVTVFLGAWNTPFPLDSFGRAANLVEALFFLAKTIFMSFLLTWFRWTMPQARLKQLSRFGWHTLLPFAFLGAGLTALWLALTHGEGMQHFL